MASNPNSLFDFGSANPNGQPDLKPNLNAPTPPTPEPPKPVTATGLVEGINRGRTAAGNFRIDAIERINRSLQQQSLAGSIDPLEEAEKRYQEISPARRIMADFFRGMQAGNDGTALKTLRESLIDKEVQRAAIRQKSQNNEMMRLQGLLNQEAAAERNAETNKTRAAVTDANNATKERGQDLGRLTAMERLEQQSTARIDALELRRNSLELAKDTLDWRKKAKGIDQDIARERIAAGERLAAQRQAEGKSAEYQPQSPEAQGLVAIAKMGDKATAKDQGFNWIAKQYDEAILSGDQERIDKWQTTAASKIYDTAIKNKPSATQKNAASFRLDTLRMFEMAEPLLDKLKLKGNETGLVNAKFEDFKRKFQGDMADDDFTQVYQLLSEHFFAFRNVKSGAAFTPEETAAYASVQATADKRLSVNKSIIAAIRQSSLKAIMADIGEDNLKYFMTYDPEGNEIFHIKGLSYKTGRKKQ